jgi:hypothetical protein
MPRLPLRSMPHDLNSGPPISLLPARRKQQLRGPTAVPAGPLGRKQAMRRTQPDTSNGDRRVAQRRSVPDRRSAVRDTSSSRRTELRRQSDVLEQPVVSRSSARRLRRRSIDNWIEVGLGQASRVTGRADR